MKIVYIITCLEVGGAQTITIDIANRVASYGNKILLLYLTGKNMYEQRINPQIEVVGLALHKNPLSFFRVFFMTLAILKKFCPDIMHAQMFHANFLSRMLRLIYRYPRLICSDHNINIGSSFRMKLCQYTNHLSDLNTNVSQEAFDFLIKKKVYKKINSKVVYNGIDLSKFVHNIAAGRSIRQQYGVMDNDFLFLNVGRLTQAKDQKNLIEAFSALSDAKLMIVGEGELLADLKRFVINKNIENKVIFAGAHLNIEDYYCAADCFVLSSAWEGFSVALIEAMACSLPVIATDVGGCKEAVDNDEYIVPADNSIQLAAKMRQIQAMQLTERQALGAENQKKAKRFDITGIVAEWINIYSILLNKERI